VNERDKAAGDCFAANDERYIEGQLKKHQVESEAMEECMADGEWSEESESDESNTAFDSQAENTLNDLTTPETSPESAKQHAKSRKLTSENAGSSKPTNSTYRLTKQNKANSSLTNQNGITSKLAIQNGVDSQSSNQNEGRNHIDGVDSILDRIDEELYCLIGTEPVQEAPLKISKPVKVKKNVALSKTDKDRLKSLGVEFDTGDKKKTKKWPTFQPGNAKSPTETEGKETGLARMQEEDLNEAGQQIKALTKDKKRLSNDGPSENPSEDETIEGEDEEENHSDLDSVAAELLEEKFIEIMNKKQGGYLRDFKAKTPVDLESVRTEDFEAQFKDHMFPSIKNRELSPLARRLLRKAETESIKTEDFGRKFRQELIPKVKGGITPRSQKTDFDLESIQTEDFEQKFKECLLRNNNNKNTEKYVKQQKKLKRTAIPEHVRGRKKKNKSGNISDPDSVKTEDFERDFHGLMVKQVAGVPITSFDKQAVDSDVDTVKSMLVHNKLHSVLAKPTSHNVPETMENESEASSGEEVTQLDTITQKLKHLLNKKDGVNSLDSDIKSIEARHASPIRLNGSEIRYSQGHPTKPTRHNIHTCKYANGDTTDGGVESESEYFSDTAEIQRETEKIQREMEMERKKKLASTPKIISSNLGARSVSSPDVSMIKSTKSEERSHPTLPEERSRSTLSEERLRVTLSPPRLNNSKTGSSHSGQSLTSKMKARSLSIAAITTNELRDLEQQVQVNREEKLSTERELKTLQESVKKTESDVRLAEMQTKENRAKAEDTRTQLMLVEFKRDNVLKELEQVTDELCNKRKMLRDVDNQAREKRETIEQFDAFGITKEQVQRLNAEKEQIESERDQLETKVRQLQSTVAERRELEHQLATTKEDLFSEQKRSRERQEALEEELENSVHRLEDLQRDKLQALSHLELIERKYIEQDRIRDEALKEKDLQFDAMKSHFQDEIIDLKKKYTIEDNELKNEVKALSDKINALQAEVNKKDLTNLELREQVIELEHEISQHQEVKESIIDDSRLKLEMLRKEREEEVRRLQQQAAVEQERHLEELRQKYDRERENRIQGHADELAAEAQTHKRLIEAKEEELQMLYEQIRQEREDARETEQRLKEDAEVKLQTAVAKERQMLEEEKIKQFRAELSNKDEDQKRALAKSMSSLNAERKLNEEMQKQIIMLKQELEESRQQKRQALQEKMAAISHGKEIEREAAHEMKDSLREKEMKEQDIERLRETIRDQDAKIQELQHQVTTSARISSIDRQERAIVQELNEECRKNASILGISPRKVSISSYHRDTDSDSPIKSSMKSPLHKRRLSGTPAAQALINVKATSQELRKFVTELRDEIDALKHAVQHGTKDKGLDIDAMKEKWQEAKMRDMEELKQRLVQEHTEELTTFHKLQTNDKNLEKKLQERDKELRDIQDNMASWKEETAERLARKFEEELNRELQKRLKERKKVDREMDRRTKDQAMEIDELKSEVLRLSSSASSSVSSPSTSLADDSSTIKLLRHLQGRVRLLRTENTSLKQMSSSDVTTSNSINDSLHYNDSTTKNMEMRVSQAELRASQAEERADRNQLLLTSKMVEMSKLQNALTTQTKELMQLQRSSSQINSRSSSRSSNPMR
ncbi:unnamed protein product, partial [Owenia fusiformis]